MKTLLDALDDADPIEIDCMWAILRERFNIKKKLQCWALILALEESEVLDQAPKDKDGRILDFKTRQELHEKLIKVSQKQKKLNKHE